MWCPTCECLCKDALKEVLSWSLAFALSALASEVFCSIRSLYRLFPCSLDSIKALPMFFRLYTGSSNSKRYMLWNCALATHDLDDGEWEVFLGAQPSEWDTAMDRQRQRLQLQEMASSDRFVQWTGIIARELDATPFYTFGPGSIQSLLGFSSRVYKAWNINSIDRDFCEASANYIWKHMKWYMFIFKNAMDAETRNSSNMSV